jgi:hypothetical protein
MTGAWFAAGMWIICCRCLGREGNGGVDEGARQSEGRRESGPVNRHTLITELSESGAGDEVIMSIAGHVSRAMLSRYSHVRSGSQTLRNQRDRDAPARGPGLAGSGTGH